MRQALGAALIVTSGSATAEDYTGVERRMFDGVYMTLAAPEFCEPAIDRGEVLNFVLESLDEAKIDPERVDGWIEREKPRLSAMAKAVYGGRRASELCDALRRTLDEVRQEN